MAEIIINCPIILKNCSMLRDTYNAQKNASSIYLGLHGAQLSHHSYVYHYHTKFCLVTIVSSSQHAILYYLSWLEHFSYSQDIQRS